MGDLYSQSTTQAITLSIDKNTGIGSFASESYYHAICTVSEQSSGDKAQARKLATSERAKASFINGLRTSKKRNESRLKVPPS